MTPETWIHIVIAAVGLLLTLVTVPLIWAIRTEAKITRLAIRKALKDEVNE